MTWRWLLLPFQCGRYLSENDVLRQDGSTASFLLFDLLTSFGVALGVSSWVLDRCVDGDMFIIVCMVILCALVIYMLLRRRYSPEDQAVEDQSMIAEQGSAVWLGTMLKDRLPVIGMVAYLQVLYQAEAFQLHSGIGVSLGSDPRQRLPPGLLLFFLQQTTPRQTPRTQKHPHGHAFVHSHHVVRYLCRGLLARGGS
jgi:hypothetical protein